MSRPVSYRESYTFGGETREYTRQRLYRADDVDFDARMHDEDVSASAATATATAATGRRRRRNHGGRRATPTPPPAGDDSVDPYAEANYTPLDERPEVIAQFRADLASSTFRSMIERRRHGGGNGDDGGGDDTAPAAATSSHEASVRAARQRSAAILAAMTRAASGQHSLFSLAYASCVPERYLREFLASTEVSCVAATLVPALLVRDERLRYHLEEEHWRRAMADAGAIFKGGETRVLDGHLRTLAPLPPAEAGWYTTARAESEHAHHDAASNTTPMRVLTFQIATLAAATALDDGAALDARRDSDTGYYVRLVFHLVASGDGGGADDDKHNVVCFRSFHFARHAQ